MEGTPFGRYQLLELVGRGGMGEVWRAYDSETKRVVAVKLLTDSLADDSVFEQRFRREARAAAGLNDPHVVPIHHFGEIDGRLYVDMRLIEGGDLLKVIDRKPMDPRRAVGIIEQIADALDAAHRIGLVHRDVKPSNILVGERDFSYLIDFGIARAEGDSALTTVGSTVGTWAYMAPERFEFGESAPSGDIYALTCVLFESLTGRRPFQGVSAHQQMVGHTSAPPPRPTGVVPQLAPGLDAVIATGMAKIPARRYASAGDLARAARAAVEVPPTVVNRPPPPPGPVPPPTRPEPVSPPVVQRQPVAPVAPPPPRKSRWPWAVVGVGLVTALAIPVGVAVSSSDSEPAASQSGTSQMPVTTSESLPPTTSESLPPATTLSKATAPAPVLEGGVTDGPVTFHILSAETRDTIDPTTSGQDQLRAKGTFLIVRMTVQNATAGPAWVLLGEQKVIVAGQTIDADSDGNFEVNRLDVVVALDPHESKDTAVVFDIPKDAPVDSIRVFGEMVGQGTDAPLPEISRP